MKNKIIVVLFITLFISFTSCTKASNNQEPELHEHNFCIIESDDEYHWKRCSYEGCNEISEKSKHDLSDIGYDNEYHWKKCSYEGCNKISDKTEHDFCISESDDEYHWKRCSCEGCDEIRDKVPHDFSITESDDEYHWLKCSIEGCTKTTEKSEHDLSAYEFDDDYHWEKCNFEGCTKTGEKSKHTLNPSCSEIIEGNVNTHSYYHGKCINCDHIIDKKAANTYIYNATIDNWFRYRVLDVTTDYVIVNSYSIYFTEEFYSPEALVEASKKYALLHVEVLETYNEYVVDANSLNRYSSLNENKEAFMIVPIQLLDYYTRCDEYIAPLTSCDISIEYSQYYVDFLVDEFGYEDDSGFSQFKNQKYASEFYSDYCAYIPYFDYKFYEYNHVTVGGISRFLENVESIGVLPIVDGKIDFSLYSEEEKELFFNTDGEYYSIDTIYRYLNKYVDEDHKFTFDYTLEELRVWLQEYSQYLYEAEQKFIEEDGKLFGITQRTS